MKLKELKASAFKTSSVVKEIMSPAKEKDVLKTFGIDVTYKAKGGSTKK